MKNSADNLADPSKFQIYFDKPTDPKLYTKKATIEGWVVPLNNLEVKNIRLFDGEKFLAVKHGFERLDVARHFSDIDEKYTRNSGFSVDFTYTGLSPYLEVDFGSGYEIVHYFEYDPRFGKIIERVYNPNLAQNWADHEDTMSVKKEYFYESKRKKPVVTTKASPKIVAFYLPQFHPIEINNKEWGMGFTEWNNVASARPRFVGHHQPMLPADLGFYDLRLESSIKDQIDLAKRSGIYGFCIYYYWFSGKKILDTPINTILNHPEWDFNFSICWANENWTRRWDGQDNEVIIAQKYKKDDALDFIKDIEAILLDKRYIRIDGKPVLVIYRPEHTNDPKEYVATWREYFKTKHNMELHIASVLSFGDTNPVEYGMDAAIQFVPAGMNYAYKSLYGTPPPTIDMSEKLLDKNYQGFVYDYRDIVMNSSFKSFAYDFPTYKCVMPSWDNDARKKGLGSCFLTSTPDLYEQWLEEAVEQTTDEHPFTFVNAWNEWAEGTVLEPTQLYGHAFLNRTANVVEKKTLGKVAGWNYTIQKTGSAKVAVVVHLYYTDQWDLLKEKLQYLDQDMCDIYITLQLHVDSIFTQKIQNDMPSAQIIVAPNRGRDILPFLHLLNRLEKVGYQSILKLHSKKSTHRKDGDSWFDELLSSLLPGSKIVNTYIQKTLSEKVVIGPAGHCVSLEKHMGSDEKHLRTLLRRSYGPEVENEVIIRSDEFAFVAGSMFYASMDALRPILKQYLSVDDFEPEKGQIDGTMAHAVERFIGASVQLEGGKLYTTSSKGPQELSKNVINFDYKYVK